MDRSDQETVHLLMVEDTALAQLSCAKVVYIFLKLNPEPSYILYLAIKQNSEKE